MADLLDALLDAVDESDDQNQRESEEAEKSVFYKTAIDDQAWFPTEESDNDGSRKTTPTRKRKRSEESITSRLEREMECSYMALPPIACSGSKKEKLPEDDLENELETLKNRMKELEEIKMRRDQEKGLNSKTSSSSKVRECPIDFSQGRKLGGDAPAASTSPKIVAKLDGNNSAYDPFFGIRVQTPKMSSVTFQSYVGIRQKVRISDLTPDSKISWEDWVTMGVLVDATPLKTANSGCQFSIWKLSDLIDCQRVIRLLLFGDSAKALWKSRKGDVIALLNASKMENKQDGFSGEKQITLTLKVDSKQKIVEIGFCPDYGQCKGIRKQDNLHCTNFVNKSKSDYCDFHLLSASKRLAARRGEFQLSSNVPPKKFNNAVKKVLVGSNLRTSKMPVPGGASSATSTTRRPVGEALQEHASVGSMRNEGSNSAGGTIATDSTAVGSKPSANLEKALRKNTVGSRHVLSQLAKSEGDQEQTAVDAVPKASFTCRQFLAKQKCVELSNLSISARHKLAKTKAIATIRNRGATSSAAMKERPQLGVSKAADGPPAKRPRLLGQISNLNKEQLQELVNKKSSHENELNEEDAQRQDEYFKIMVAKEKVDQRAAEVMSLKNCKVVTCRACKYTWHGQSSLCKQNGHVVFWHTAEKRFFKCRECKNRVVAYDKYPSTRCSCGSTKFIRVAMRDESKGPQLPSETLKIRGDEEPFVNC